MRLLPMLLALALLAALGSIDEVFGPACQRGDTAMCNLLEALHEPS